MFWTILSSSQSALTIISFDYCPYSSSIACPFCPSSARVRSQAITLLYDQVVSTVGQLVSSIFIMYRHSIPQNSPELPFLQLLPTHIMRILHLCLELWSTCKRRYLLYTALLDYFQSKYQSAIYLRNPPPSSEWHSVSSRKQHSSQIVRIRPRCKSFAGRDLTST